MAISEKLKVAFLSPASLAGHKTIESYLESTYDPDFRILRMLSEAMNFDFEIVPHDNAEIKLLPNSSWTGVIGMINRSEADMMTKLLLKTEERVQAVHFIYPFKLYGATFIVEKPEYSPRIFGMFEALSLHVWSILAFFAIFMVAITSMLKKSKYSLLDAIFHVSAICFKQSIVIKSRTLSENILTYSWMVGTMLLGFCYTSVLLSFLTFPSIFTIKNMENLAFAVENDGYNCMFDSYIVAGPMLMAESKLKPRAIVGKNMLANPKVFGKLEDFIRMKEKVAFFTIKEKIPSLPEKYYVSDESINESMAVMLVRKDFCCKEQLDALVHRIVAAGLEAKVRRDGTFLSGLKLDRGSTETSGERKLTLKDFMLAFVILLLGHVLSLVVLLIEVVLGFKRDDDLKERKDKKRTEFI